MCVLWPMVWTHTSSQSPPHRPGPRTTVISFHVSFFTPLNTSSELHVGIETLRFPSTRLTVHCFLFLSWVFPRDFLVLNTLLHRMCWSRPITQIWSLIVTVQSLFDVLLDNDFIFAGNQENDVHSFNCDEQLNSPPWLFTGVDKKWKCVSAVYP